MAVALICLAVNGVFSRGIASAAAMDALAQIQQWETNHPEKHLRNTLRNSDGQVFCADTFIFKEKGQQTWRVHLQSINPSFEYILFPINGTNYAYFPVTGLLVVQDQSTNGFATGFFDNPMQNVDLSKLMPYASKISVEKQRDGSALMVRYDTRKLVQVGMVPARMEKMRISSRMVYAPNGRVTGIVNQYGNIESDISVEWVSTDPQTIRQEAPPVMDLALLDSSKSFAQAIHEDSIVSKKCTNAPAILTSNAEYAQTSTASFMPKYPSDENLLKRMFRCCNRAGLLGWTLPIGVGFLGILLRHLRQGREQSNQEKTMAKRLILQIWIFIILFAVGKIFIPDTLRIFFYFVFINWAVVLLVHLCLKWPKTEEVVPSQPNIG